ncbi:BRO-N domain-containing protein [Vibrio crassostreae]|uniref:BRO-N domain-containing protein n=1 Tax=Vibrio crassostreae TaxID=246167 RepID=UPI001B30BABF|nr:BRO family protein [Vibrio crassostreae]
MTQVTNTFAHTIFGTLTTITKDGDVWFVGKEVAEKLGYQNGSRDINRHVDDEDKATVAIHDGSQNRNQTAINESGLYALVFGSTLPTAKKFKRWVTSEVLPSIRKTGSYSTPADYADALEAYAKEVRAKEKIKLELAQSEQSNRELKSENSELYFHGSKQVTELIKHIPNYMDFVNGSCAATATEVAEKLKPSFYNNTRCSAIGVNRALESIGFIQRSETGSVLICDLVMKLNIGSHEHDSFPVWNITALISCVEFMVALEDYINRELSYV